ncbi:hydantoinase B/oxoprolinase family protein [Bacillus licheniformis]|nr:hydantoinase B/oxoprolinase family protein [Bacillus licheniformis]
MSSWPDGTYVGETFADHDFQGNRDIKVRATVTVKGSDLHIDFTGSSPQVKASSTARSQIRLRLLCRYFDLL